MMKLVNVAAFALLALSEFSLASDSGIHGGRVDKARRIHNPEVAENLAARSKKLEYTPPPHAPYQKVASTWWAGWHGYPGGFTPEDISYNKYTNIVYAFIVPAEDVRMTAVNVTEAPLLRRVVEYAHRVGTTVTGSVGGWAGSQFWSGAVNTSTHRQEFVKVLVEIAKNFELDGFDFDWEYPYNSGVGCNENGPTDTANFLEFIKELRQTLPKNKILSAATPLLPFLGPNGNPSKDVSEFAKYLNYIEIMNYDVYGPWTDTAGPNSPLRDSCVTVPSEGLGSAEQGVNSWNKAGIPLDQIVLGVANYGHGYNVTPNDAYKHVKRNGKMVLTSQINNSYPLYDAVHQTVGDIWDGGPFIDQCGNQEGQGGAWDYWGLIRGGFLKTNGDVAPGISYFYDTCSQTPTVYNPKIDTWVEYDSPESFEVKGKWIKERGIRGFASWEAGGDYKDRLLDAIRSGAGFHSPTHRNPVPGGEHYIGPSH